MGQKVNPHGARVGVILDWSTKWYAGKKDFSNNLIEDYNIRKAIPKMIEETTKKSARDARGANPSISRIDIQRAGTKLHISIYTARPGVAPSTPKSSQASPRSWRRCFSAERIMNCLQTEFASSNCRAYATNPGLLW